MNGTESQNAGQNFNMAPNFLARQNNAANQHQFIPQVHIPSKSSVGLPAEGWASDFSKMHISQHSQQQQGSSQGWHEQFLQNNPTVTNVPTNYVGSQLPMYSSSSMQLPASAALSQQNAMAASNEAELFEAAFNNIEKHIDSQASASPAVAEVVDVKEDQKDEVGTDENAELSKIANHIVNNIDRKNEKLKSSNFMMLMQQLSEKQVRLEGDKFVDDSGVDVRDAALAAASSSGDNSQAKSTQPDTTETSRTSRLPDPFEAFDEEKLDSTRHKPYSSFEFAQMLSSQGVPHPSSWEEKYDEYV